MGNWKIENNVPIAHFVNLLTFGILWKASMLYKLHI